MTPRPGRLMSRTRTKPIQGGVPARDAERRLAVRRGDEGMTLIELLVTLLILPLVIGGLAFGLVAVFSLQSSVTGRITDSGDAQTLSASFSKDVQSAQWITDYPTPMCGTGVQLLALEWGSAPGGYLNYVSYDSQQNGSTTTYSLIRNLCTTAPSATPSSTQTVATDLSATTALPTSESPLPLISCAPTASGCSTQADTITGVTASVVPLVTLTVTETQSVIAGSSTPFAFALSATPRAFTEAVNPTKLMTFAPFSLLSTTSSTALTLGNNSILSINLGTGLDNGALAIASPFAGAISMSPGSQLNATSIYTSDTALNSVSGSGAPSVPLSEYYTNKIGDPFVSLTPPADPPSGGSTETCSPSGGVYTCPPGNYATDPGTTMFGSGATVQFTPGGTFWFEKGLTLQNNVNATFATGTYIFDSTTTALSTVNNTTVTGTSGVLFYVHTGAVTFGNDATINLKGLAQYQYVAVWDVAASGSVTLGNNGTAGYGYGGIYVPNGQVILNNNGTVTAAFLVTSTASISNNVNLNITSP